MNAAPGVVPRRAAAGLALGALCVLASGCAPARQAPLYGWDDFTWQQYRHLSRAEVSGARQAEALEATAARIRASGRPLPPGLRAHQGLLRLEAGDAEGAARLWEEEKRAFPESAVYMDRLIRRANGLRDRRPDPEDPT